MTRSLPVRCLGALLAVLTMVLATAAGPSVAETTEPSPVRFAQFNASLYRGSNDPDDTNSLLWQLERDFISQIQQVAHIIQHVRPDVLVINEFDYDPSGRAANLFRQNYLEVPQSTLFTDPTDPIVYPYAFAAPSNTGIPTGFDLNNNGSTDDPEDAFGFGRHAGQYGMLVLSKHPIVEDEVRTFQEFKWKDMPDALRPKWPQNPDEPFWHTEEEWQALRLSSKSHWDVPIEIDGKVVHVLASHPTPPVFDGVPGDTVTDPVDFNGRRNSDEIRFWADYITPGIDYMTDDQGHRGGLTEGDSFVVMGDLNADPTKGDSRPGAIQQLLDHPLVQDPMPIGATFGTDTASFGLRADYVLPSIDLTVTESAVFWPAFVGDPWIDPVTAASDHRLVYTDLIIPEPGVVAILAVASRGLMLRSCPSSYRRA